MEINELKMLQALPLDIKIAKSKLRIEEWYRYFSGKVYVSFSGGKDSTVLLHLVRSLYPEVVGVYSDTGLEFPEIRNFVKETENVVWLKPKMNHKEIIKTYGYPVIGKEVADCIEGGRKGQIYRLNRLNGILKNKDGGKSRYDTSKYKFLMDAPFKISGKCCNEMKKKPFKLYERESENQPILGTMTEESQLREQSYLKTGCNSFESKRPISAPISFWNEKDIWNYIKLYNVSYSKIYDMGYERTGCMFCAFGAHLEKGENRFQKMQRTHPNQWNYCMKDISEGGLGMKEVLDFINVPYMNNVDKKKTSNGIAYQQFKIV